MRYSAIASMLAFLGAAAPAQVSVGPDGIRSGDTVIDSTGVHSGATHVTAAGVRTGAGGGATIRTNGNRRSTRRAGWR